MRMRQRFLTHLLVFSSFYEQLAWAPVLVILATDAGDPAAVAVAASAYSLANLLGNLLFGHLSDRVGRLRIAGGGMLGMAATALLHLSAGNPALLVGARFLHGLAAAAVAPAALAKVSDGAPASRRGEAMARVGLIIALASMMAPPITGRIARGLGVDVAVTTLAAGLALVGGLTLVAAGRGGQWVSANRASGPSNTDEPFSPSLTLIGGALAFALMFGQNVLFYALPLQGSQIGLDAAQVGGLLSAFAVGALVAFVPPLSRASDRYGRLTPLLAGMGLTAVGLLALSGAGSTAAMRVALLVYGLGFGLAFPAISAISADAAGQGRRGLAFGVLTAAFSAGSIVGPLVTRSLDQVVPPFAVAGAVGILGIAVSLAGYRQFRPVPASPPVGPGA